MFLFKRNIIILMVCLLVLIPITIFSSPVITPNGKMTYRIPIKIPAGTMGMQPSLSLVYNSGSGNGMVGYGWFLSGFSSITRDRDYPVNFDDKDHYMYNGSRLIYNAAHGYYHTENENYLRIYAFNLNTAGSYWVVMRKDGSKSYYGYNAAEHTAATDGHINAIGKGGLALAWALSMVEDVNGNYYTIEYAEDAGNGDYYPRKITYTKNNGITKYKTVELHYEYRTDHYKKYVPTLMDEDCRLKWIIVKIDGHLYRGYRLDYDYSSLTGRSRLIKVLEIGSDGASVLPAHTFTWQDGGDHWVHHHDYSYTLPDYFMWGEKEVLM